MKNFTALTVTLALASIGSASDTKSYTFSTLKAPMADVVEAKADSWLTDSAIKEKAITIWAQGERTVFDRLIDVICLGSPDAAKLLAEARDPAQPAPKEMPVFFKDTKVDQFVRSNFALAYAR